MYDLILVNSPIHNYRSYPKYQSSYSTPVGLLYLATVAHNGGFATKILDAEQLQLTPLEIASSINQAKPRYVGFNSFSINFPIVLETLNLLQPEIGIIVGGPHVSSMPAGHFQHTLDRASILVKGDGELTLSEILGGVSPEEIVGVLYQDADGRIHDTGPAREVALDTLPLPDRSLIDGEPYTRDGYTWADISTSRGCVFRCKFCAGSCRSNGTTYRRRSLARTLDEIHYLVQEYAVDAIQIIDDLPFNGLRDLDAFLEMLEEEKLQIAWEFNMPLQFLRSISDSQVARLSRCGIKRLTFGIESGSYLARRVMGKNATNDEITSLLDRLASHQVQTKGYFILGFPHEPRTEMETTLRFARDLHSLATREGSSYFSPRVFMFKPMPGSALWKQLLMSGYTAETMLEYGDFIVDADYFKKHAWGTRVKYSEVEPVEIEEMINEFYNEFVEAEDAGGVYS